MIKRLFALTLVLVSSVLLSKTSDAKTPVAVIGVKHDTIKLEVASSTEEIQRGLMYRTSLPNDSGMVFLFHPAHATRFWMYHTLIPLDMIFINEDKIVRICENVPPCRSEDPRKCPLYPQEGDITVSEVIEVNGNYCKTNGIKPGDIVQFSIGD